MKAYLILLVGVLLPICALACSDHDSTCIQLEVLPNGKLGKILMHNLTYAEMADVIRVVSKIEIRAKSLPDMKSTFSSKDVSWDAVIWGVFTTPEMEVNKIEEGVYEVVLRVTESRAP